MFAITGLIGSGKSLVSSMVREAGFDVLDVDALAHVLYKENSVLRAKIAKEFGSEAITENGINRKYISNLVFSDKQKLERLESIVHPVLQKEIEKINPPFIEAAVLYKWPEFAKKMEKIWVVEADENIRIERLLKKGLLKKEEIEIRMQTQMHWNWELETRNLECLERIVNNGSMEECKSKVLQLLEKYMTKKIKTNISLKKHTTFKIGGNARFFAEPESAFEIAELIKSYENFFILGLGSNVLFSDDGFDGLVIKIGKNFLAGKSLHSLIQEAANDDLGGIEKLDGIPGSVGGAICMNAGAHGQQISDCIKSVTYIAQNGQIKTRTKEECKFSYRSSSFKNEIIISAEFDFISMPKEIINKNRREVLAWRKEKQPLQYPNAGSVFKNPTGKSAGALIDSCGLKGCMVGDAQVSELHANFIVNRGNATSLDVKTLMEKIIKDVKKNHGVVLEPEIIMPSSSSKV